MKIETHHLIKYFPSDYADWDKAHRSKNLFAGLELFKRTGGRLTIAARHWPHLCCWSWSLTFDVDLSGRQPFRYFPQTTPKRPTGGEWGFWRFHYRWQDYKLARPGPPNLELAAHMQRRFDERARA